MQVENYLWQKINVNVGSVPVDKIKSILISKPAIFIYGFMTGWIAYLLVLVAVMRSWG